jgi:hypothetical protein
MGMASLTVVKETRLETRAVDLVEGFDHESESENDGLVSHPLRL